jgi:hypothetical protein
VVSEEFGEASEDGMVAIDENFPIVVRRTGQKTSPGKWWHPMDGGYVICLAQSIDGKRGWHKSGSLTKAGSSMPSNHTHGSGHFDSRKRPSDPLRTRQIIALEE